MTFTRGAVGLARFPHSAGGRGKKRPVVIVQADSYNLIGQLSTSHLQQLDACLKAALGLS